MSIQNVDLDVTAPVAHRLAGGHRYTARMDYDPSDRLESRLRISCDGIEIVAAEPVVKTTQRFVEAVLTAYVEGRFMGGLVWRFDEMGVA